MAQQPQSRDTQARDTHARDTPMRTAQARGRQMQDAMRGQADSLGNGTSQMVEHAAKRFQDISIESYRYLQGAVELNADAMNRMIGCRTIGEMADVHRDYLKEAIDHAFAASRRMYGISAEMADEIGSSVNATLHDVAEEASRQREDTAREAGAAAKRQ